MKRSILALITLTAIVAVPCSLRAVNNGSGGGNSSAPTGGAQSYEPIWQRNVFDLKPVPPPDPPKVETTEEPPPNVRLVAILTILGKKQAGFAVLDKPGPGKPQEKEHNYMLCEGERRDQLTVKEIDPKARKVKIEIQGIVSTITFETNRASGPAAGGPPGQPVMAPPPGLTPPGFTPAMPGGNGLPARQLRGVGAAGNGGVNPQAYNGYNGANGGAPAYNGQQAYNGYGGSGGSNLGNLLTAPAATGQQQNQAANVPNLSSDEATALLALQHKMNESNPNFPPAPPQISTLLGAAANSANQNETPQPTTSGTTANQNPLSRAPGTRSSGTLRGFTPPPLPGLP